MAFDVERENRLRAAAWKRFAQLTMLVGAGAAITLAILAVALL